MSSKNLRELKKRVRLQRESLMLQKKQVAEIKKLERKKGKANG